MVRNCFFGPILQAWCNGSIRVSKTFDLGSNPSACAKTPWLNYIGYVKICQLYRTSLR